MFNYKKYSRKLTLAILERSDSEKLVSRGESNVLRAFHRAAASITAYQTILAEHEVTAESIQTIECFSALCPTLNKDNTFARFSLSELCMPGALNELAGILTSSGQSRTRLAFGLSTWKQFRRTADEIDLGLEYAFQVDSKKTLLINSLPMGVRFSSNTVAIAETSVREDMAVALVTELGDSFEQIILVGDPLFLKLLTDYAHEQGVDWGHYRIHLIIGEEIFGENYRQYLAGQFQLNADDPETGFIGSSMGVAELGLNLFYETPQTIKLRRLVHTHPELLNALLGLVPETSPLPVLFVYNPLRIYVEILDADASGYGQLTLTVLDVQADLPLLRYQTGDEARLLLQAEINSACDQTGAVFKDKLNLPVIALKGRSKDQLRDGTHVGQYKDALYVYHDIAFNMTGAVRLQYESDTLQIHIQLRRGCSLDDSQISRLATAFPDNVTSEQLCLWPYDKFPFAMTLDYERKFNYFS